MGWARHQPPSASRALRRRTATVVAPPRAATTRTTPTTDDHADPPATCGLLATKLIGGPDEPPARTPAADALAPDVGRAGFAAARGDDDVAVGGREVEPGAVPVVGGVGARVGARVGPAVVVGAAIGCTGATLGGGLVVAVL